MNVRQGNTDRISWVTRREQAGVRTADLSVANTWIEQVSTNVNRTRFRN